MAPHAVPGGPASPPVHVARGPLCTITLHAVPPLQVLGLDTFWSESALTESSTYLDVPCLPGFSAPRRVQDTCFSQGFSAPSGVQDTCSSLQVASLIPARHPQCRGGSPMAGPPTSLPLPIPRPSPPSPGALGLSVDMANHSRGLHSGLSCQDLVSLYLLPRLRVQFLTWCSRLSPRISSQVPE